MSTPTAPPYGAATALVQDSLVPFWLPFDDFHGPGLPQDVDKDARIDDYAPQLRNVD